MAVTCNVNNLTVVHAASGGIAASFPDVCKTPMPPGGPVPIPYPNVARSADTANGSTTVKIDGKPIMLKDSYFSTSTGDEPGSVGGVVSGKIKGKAEPIGYSFDVKVDGKNVFRLTDPMRTNCGSNPNAVCPAEAQAFLLSSEIGSADDEPCKKIVEEARKQKREKTNWSSSGVLERHRAAFERASAGRYVIYIRQTKPFCEDWIAAEHVPKPHAILKGTTITPDHVPKVAKWMERTKVNKVSSRADLLLSNANYPSDPAYFIGVVGSPDPEDPDGSIIPDKFNAKMHIEKHSGGNKYVGKWVTGDYDLFEVLYVNTPCKQISDDDFGTLMEKINKDMGWDGIQHGPQTHWKPKATELEDGKPAFNMTAEFQDVLAGRKPLDHVVPISAKRSLKVIDENVTVVCGDISVALERREDVRDAFRCKECDKNIRKD
jgi:uncharacterized Zn-binding protein involved in type VI secretion